MRTGWRSQAGQAKGLGLSTSSVPKVSITLPFSPICPPPFPLSGMLYEVDKNSQDLVI